MKTNRLVCKIIALLLMLLFAFRDTGITNADSLSVSEWDSMTEKEQIRAVQELLIKYEWLIGEADGVAGKRTNNAVIKYRTFNDHLQTNYEINRYLYNELLKETEPAYKNSNLLKMTYDYWYNIVDASDERSDIYNECFQTITKYKELKREGKTGSRSYAECIASLIPDGYNADYVDILEKYVTKDHEGEWAFAKYISKYDSSLILYTEDDNYWYWEMMNSDYAFVPRICLVSEMDFKATIATIGMFLDESDEAYSPEPFPDSWLDMRNSIDSNYKSDMVQQSQIELPYGINFSMKENDIRSIFTKEYGEEVKWFGSDDRLSSMYGQILGFTAPASFMFGADDKLVQMRFVLYNYNQTYNTIKKAYADLQGDEYIESDDFLSLIDYYADSFIELFGDYNFNDSWDSESDILKYYGKYNEAIADGKLVIECIWQNDTCKAVLNCRTLKSGSVTIRIDLFDPDKEIPIDYYL